MCVTNAYRYSQIQQALGGAVLTEQLAKESVFFLQSPSTWFRHERVKLTTSEKLQRVPEKGIQCGRALHLLCFILACSTGAFFCTSWPWLYHPAAPCEMLGLMCQSLAWASGSPGHSESFASL